MNRSSILLAAVVLSLAGAPAATAQSPVGVDHYKFLPRYSVLNRTGGFTGWSTDWRVQGPFDLVTHPTLIAIWPPQFVYTFENVAAWGNHPLHDMVLLLDKELNMSGLTGRKLRTPGPIDLLHFTGKSENGAVSLYAAEFGPFLYLRGETTPPPGAADFYEYTLKAVARQKPKADFDHNDTVDGADLAQWMPRFGLNPGMGASSTIGDADGDRDVDGADFLAWQREAGEPSIDDFDALMNAAIASAAAISASASTVPEPGSIALALAAGFGLLRTHRRR